MEYIRLIHAELTDHSYQRVKLEGYAKVHGTLDVGAQLIIFSIGKDDLSLPCLKVMEMDGYEVVKFVTYIEKQSGLSSEGFSFQLRYSSYMTDAYYIGGRHGEVILEDTNVKQHQLYLHLEKLTGTVLIKSSSIDKKVRFVCFNESYSTLTEATFREYAPYKQYEIWEYSFLFTEEILNQNWSFYVELSKSNATFRDDNFNHYYKLWDQVPRTN